MLDAHGPVEIFDLCGTLVRDDTTIGALRWHFRRRGEIAKEALVAAIGSRFHPARIVLAAAEKITGRPIAKHLMVRLLRGELASEFSESSRQYAEWAIRERTVKHVIGLLDESRARGHQPMIASASLDPVVAAFANVLSVAYVASTLENIDCRLTGKYEVDIAGKKENAISRKWGSGVLANIQFTVSDNLSDISLMRRGRDCLAIAHSQRGAYRWEKYGVRVTKVFVE